MRISQVIATFFGIGYVGKGSGTIAALVFCLLVFVFEQNTQLTEPVLPFLSVLLFFTGVFAATHVESIWGKDSKRVVIDEVLGMAISLLFLPINAFVIVSGFVLFRFFDIVKPLWIRRTEALPGGWGVMVDDLVAGIYANLSLRVILFLVASLV